MDRNGMKMEGGKLVAKNCDFETIRSNVIRASAASDIYIENLTGEKAQRLFYLSDAVKLFSIKVTGSDLQEGIRVLNDAAKKTDVKLVNAQFTEVKKEHIVAPGVKLVINGMKKEAK